MVLYLTSFISSIKIIITIKKKNSKTEDENIKIILFGYIYKSLKLKLIYLRKFKVLIETADGVGLKLMQTQSS